MYASPPDIVDIRIGLTLQTDLVGLVQLAYTAGHNLR